MLRTNSKKAKENVKNYMLNDKEYILTEYAAYKGIELNSNDEILAYIYDIYQSEKYYSIEDMAKLNLSDYTVFKQWASGLALGSTFDYFYHNIAKKTVMQILEETEKEAARFTETDAENLLTQLIYREILAAKRRIEK